MNADDFEQVRALLVATRAVLDGIRACCRLEPDTVPADVRTLLRSTEDELGQLIEVVQNRRRMAWESRNPDHPAHHPSPIRWPEPTRVPESADVVRLDLNGCAPDRAQPKPSGRWAQEHSRRRRHG